MELRLKQRLRDLDHRFARRIRHVAPNWYVQLRWPLIKPYQRSALKLLPPGGGIGDELLASGVIAEIKQRNPFCKITLVSRHPDFWNGHPMIDRCVDGRSGVPQDAVNLGYGPQVPGRGNVFTMISERVGLAVTVIRPALPPLNPSSGFHAWVRQLPRPLIVMQTDASGWTPNKNWGAACWRETALEIARFATVVEMGKTSVLVPEDTQDGLSLKSVSGKTTLHDAACLIGEADVFVGPESAGMHMAAAYAKASVVLFGGYTAPENFPYPGNIALFTELPCSPCWLSTACPYDLKCLKSISPKTVVQAVNGAIGRSIHVI